MEMERKRVHKGTAGMSTLEKMERNRASNRRSNLSRVRIGEHLERWNRVKKKYGLRTDVDMAKMLLDSFEAIHSSKEKVTPLVTSAPLHDQGPKNVANEGLNPAAAHSSKQQTIPSTSLNGARNAGNEVFEAVQAWQKHISSLDTSTTFPGAINVAKGGLGEEVQPYQQHVSYLGIATSLHGPRSVSSETMEEEQMSPLDMSTSLHGATKDADEGDSGSDVSTMTSPSRPGSPSSLLSPPSKKRRTEQISDRPSCKAQNLLAVIARLPALQKGKTKDERL